MDPFELKPGRTLTRSGCFGNWWSALAALPPDRGSVAYQRLRRVWEDQTRLLGKKGTPATRRHEFVLPTHETHLTTSLWENFSLFEEAAWLPALLLAAGMDAPDGVSECQWSYEWENEGRMCDVVIAYRDRAGQRHVVIVEAKSLNVLPGDKDFREDYYLGMKALGEFATRRLLYCVDEPVRERVAAATSEFAQRPGLITWQALGGLQIGLVGKLELPERIRRFIAGSVQFQFAIHDIRPTALAIDYLGDEPPITDIEITRSATKGQATEVRSRRFWDE